MIIYSNYETDKGILSVPDNVVSTSATAAPIFGSSEGAKSAITMAALIVRAEGMEFISPDILLLACCWLCDNSSDGTNVLGKDADAIRAAFTEHSIAPSLLLQDALKKLPRRVKCWESGTQQIYLDARARSIVASAFLMSRTSGSFEVTDPSFIGHAIPAAYILSALMEAPTEVMLQMLDGSSARACSLAESVRGKYDNA